MSKKYPYDKFVKFLILARNEYVNIIAFLRAARIGNIDTRYLRNMEKYFFNKGNAKEAGYIKSHPLRVVKKGAKPKKDAVLKVEIPKQLKALAKKEGTTKSPFTDRRFRMIVESPILRRNIEVYLTTKIPSKDIANLINDRFRMDLTAASLDNYKSWMYDINGMTPDLMEDYMCSLGKEECNYKKMAYLEKPDYIKWKMQESNDIDIEDALRSVMAGAYWKLHETMRAEDRVSHAAALSWNRIFHEAMKALTEYQRAQRNKTDSDVYRSFRLVLNNGGVDGIVNFDDLISPDD